MTSHPCPADGVGPAAPDGGFQARFESLPAARGRPATVLAVGEIDLGNVGQFHEALAAAAAASRDITVDMAGIAYCDSAAIRALFTAARQVSVTIKVTAASPVTTLLSVSGLDQVATVIVTG